MRYLVYSALAAAAVTAASPASAREITIRIELGELDIADPSDDAEIRDRIVTQVARSCRSRAILSGSQAVEECKADGVGKALDELEARRKLIAAN